MSTNRRGYPKRMSATLPKHIEKINAPRDSDLGREPTLQAGRTIVGDRLYANDSSQGGIISGVFVSQRHQRRIRPTIESRHTLHEAVRRSFRMMVFRMRGFGVFRFVVACGLHGNQCNGGGTRSRVNRACIGRRCSERACKECNRERQTNRQCQPLSHMRYLTALGDSYKLPHYSDRALWLLHHSHREQTYDPLCLRATIERRSAQSA